MQYSLFIACALRFIVLVYSRRTVHVPFIFPLTFSPDGKFVAGGVGCTIHVWDITSSDICIVRVFTGHTSPITSLAFTFSIISLSRDRSIKFWQIGALSTDLVTSDPEPIPPVSAPISSISLQANHGIVISSDSTGVVRTWNVSTGVCKAAFCTPAGSFTPRDAQLVNGRLIFVWHTYGKIHFWDAEKGELFQIADARFHPSIISLRISGDVSMVFLLDEKYI